VTLDAAYAACARLARTHYENFPVASHLLPRRMRPHVAAVYAFARLADDIADEGDAPLELRNARLDEWLARLDAAVHGGGPPASTVLGADMAEMAPAVFTALGATVRECALPPALFEDLVSAFRQDTTVARYATWPDLLDYCRRSANPVGRLVLRIGGWRDPELDEASDAVCSALQLTNFWQDLAVDWTRGRLYVPAQEYQRTGAVTASLDQRQLTPAWRDALSACAGRTRDLFTRGRAVCDGVSGRLRWELRLTWLGGMRILDRLDRRGYDVFAERPTLGASDVPPLLWRAVEWRA
jgi:hydroxysqualene synthase